MHLRLTPYNDAAEGLPWWLVGGIVLLSLVLPVVGASIVLILLGEGVVRLVRRRRAAPPEPMPV